MPPPLWGSEGGFISPLSIMDSTFSDYVKFKLLERDLEACVFEYSKRLNNGIDTSEQEKMISFYYEELATLYEKIKNKLPYI